ncbi:MAG: TldD/PmbA family protein [Deltaproteobacteria bacterium]|nr:TldD/PmbA family protein [Deltaproteobacteria bacterium]
MKKLSSITFIVCTLMLSQALAGKEKLQDPRLIYLQAMREELTRTMKELSFKDFPQIYFTSYLVRFVETYEIGARFGNIYSIKNEKFGLADVDVRVGTYEYDHTSDKGLDWEFSWSSPTYKTSNMLPLEPDVNAVRNILWLLSDSAYKANAAAYLKKKGKAIYEVEEKEKKDCFSREEKSSFFGENKKLVFDIKRNSEIAKRLSALFIDYPEIIDSDIKLQAEKITTIFINSEGTEIIMDKTYYSFVASAYLRADDGMLLTNDKSFYSTQPDKFLSEEELARQVKNLINELIELKNAPLFEPYTGPAILEPEATGVLFHEAIGHRLEGDRMNDQSEGQTFKDKIGQVILPRFISIYDDPTLKEFAGLTLNGYYEFDEQGIKAQKVTLVEKGVLKNYLMSRKPVKGFNKSNGHGRAGIYKQPMSRMATTYIKAEEAVSYTELKKMLIEEVKKQGKPYGLIIKNIKGGSTNTSSFGYQAFDGVPRSVYRVYPDGREELVRGVELVGTPLITINKIIKASNEYGVFNGYCGAESGFVPVSTIAPHVLISEVELQSTEKFKERPPILPSPWSRKRQ